MAQYLRQIDNLWNTTSTDGMELSIGEDSAFEPDTNDGSDKADQITAIIVILCIFSVIGTLGNGLVLYVFTRTTVKLTSTIFILALATTDFIACLIVIPYTVYAIQTKYILKYDVSCKVYQFLITCNVPLSAFIMVAIAVDRYICICHPFVHIMTVKRAKICVAILAVFATILGLITALGFSVYKVKNIEETVNTKLNDTSEVVLLNGNATSGASGRSEHPKYVQAVEQDGEDDEGAQTKIREGIVYTGLCDKSSNLLPIDFIEIYQKIYSSFYLFSLLTVLILYGMIYSSVTKQRAKRRAQKLGNVKKVVNTQCQTDESTMPLNNINNHNNGNQKNMKLRVDIEGETVSTRLTSKTENGSTVSRSESVPINRPIKLSPVDSSRERKDHNRLANIKTAIMLFIVTIVFIIAFLPAWLMAHGWLDFNHVVFYMYFSYNVGNPVIYAFMNQMFRENLGTIFSSCTSYCKVRRR